MAMEAEAAREVRAKVIAAEGEMRASHSLKEASDVISTSPAALQTDGAEIDSPKHRIDEENQDEQDESSIYIAGAAVLHRSGMFPWKRELL